MKTRTLNASMSDIPQPNYDSTGAQFERLVEIMRTLRSTDGCPWDREQTLASLRPFLLEETYEVIDAINRNDTQDLRNELGDLVFEVIFLAQICNENNQFTISDALNSAATKLIHRHPHVFSQGDTPHAKTITATEVKRRWEEIKATEQEAAGNTPSLLGGIPPTMPALLRAYRIGKRTATVGFDWVQAAEVLEKTREELAELESAVGDNVSDKIEEELGDLLFTVANLARHLNIEPEGALNRANVKFSKSFSALEKHFHSCGRALRDVSADEMERQWIKIKRMEDASYNKP